jgi:hypothetical protein
MGYEYQLNRWPKFQLEFKEWLRGRLGRNSLPNVQNFSLCSAKGEVILYMFTENQNRIRLTIEIGKTSPCSDILSQSLEFVAASQSGNL